MRSAPAHYIRANEDTRIPRRIVVIDTEAERHQSKGREVQTWSLAVARFIWWTNKGIIHQSQLRYETAQELWSAICGFTREKRRTVAYCHNLIYDMRISKAMQTLCSMSWNMTDMRMDSRGTWSKWTRGAMSLTLCDSASIFPTTLDEIAKSLQMRKPSLPNWSDREALFKRCEQDVNILSTALLNYFDWLRGGQCGNWAITGASQSWNHWRHSHYTHKILVHDNQDALEAERRAMWTGRAEAYKWGKIFGKRLYDYDWSNAYPYIARNVSVPTKYRYSITAPSVESLHRLHKRYAVLADITVDVRQPILPTEYNGRIIWPTGTFRTIVWDPETRLLRGDNRITRVHRAWVYSRQPALRDWAETILQQLHDKSEETEPWKKIILKHWSRALIGRFGMRYQAWDHMAEANHDDVKIWQCGGDLAPDSGEMMQVGKQVYVKGEPSEVSDGCPQITGYIMSEARAKLWRVLSLLPNGTVYYVDTDSFLVDRLGHNAIQLLEANPDTVGLRVKRTFTGAEIYGPRSIILGNKPRIAGLPKRAIRLGNGDFYGEAWQSMARAIEVGNLDSVHITGRGFRVLWNDGRRIRTSDGSTVAYHVRDGEIVGKNRPQSKNARRAQVSALAGIRKSIPQTANGGGTQSNACGIPGSGKGVHSEQLMVDGIGVMPIDSSP